MATRATAGYVAGAAIAEIARLDQEIAERELERRRLMDWLARHPDVKPQSRPTPAIDRPRRRTSTTYPSIV